MTNKPLVFASLLAVHVLAGANLAHAAPSDPGPGFVTGWKASNGADMLASGVLGRDVSLLGGVAHRIGDNLTSSFFGSAAANLTQAEAQQLFIQRGIEADYILSGGNALLAALAGNSAAVINDGSGAVLMPSTPSSPAAAPPANGGAPSWSGGGGDGAGGSTPTPWAPPAVGDAPSAPPVTVADPIGGNAGANDPGPAIAAPLPTELIGDVPDPALAIGADDAPPALTAQVPEPGVFALMLAGLAGWAASTRRARRWL